MSQHPWHKIQPPPVLWQRLKPLARQMRSEPTPAENHLWQRLRRRQIEGVKFRRQVPIERFIVDFCSFDVRLIVEVDGHIHHYSQEEDAVRDAYLESIGFTVIRICNEDVFQNLEEVLEQIRTQVVDSDHFSWASQTGELQ